MRSVEQKNLYSLNKYIDNFIHLYDEKKLPNKIMLSGYKGIGKSVLAFHLINYILSKEETYQYNKKDYIINNSNKSFRLVNENIHPNFHCVDIEDEKKSISIDQVRDIISFCNKSSFNDSERIVLINNVEKLNKNSSNALLKVLEEPNEKVNFILIKDSSKIIIDTIYSRCIKFNISIDDKQKNNILNKLLDKSFINNLNNDFKNYFFSPGVYLNLYHFYDENNIEFEISIDDLLKLIIKKKLYKTNLFVKNNIGLFFELYFSKKFFLLKNNVLAFNDYKKFINDMHNTYKYNLDLESILLQYEKRLVNEK
jgi:DNA polymerase-3 subunit delta'